MAQGRARVVRRALVAGRAGSTGRPPVVRLPVRVVAVGVSRGRLVVVGARAVVGVGALLAVPFQTVVSAGAVLVQLPVLTVAVVSGQSKS